MKHFPVFLNLVGKRVVVAGAGACAAAKLRLLLKTEADIWVIGTDGHEQVREWAADKRITLIERDLEPGDLDGATLLYGAQDNATLDARTLELGQAASVLTSIVDNLEASEFITPALVDRDPVTIAIGTEGTAPVLARQLKAEIEQLVPQETGTLARIAAGFRKRVGALPFGLPRREFWKTFFGGIGAQALRRGGEVGVRDALEWMLGTVDAMNDRAGHVTLVGAGPGDPELLTLKARKVLHDADVVLYDRLVDPRVLELARREAELICVGKKPGGPAWKQSDIDAEMISHARAGHHVVRLKSGDPMMFGRADEELDALDAAGIEHDVVPGVTSASAAASAIGSSLTQRGRNTNISFITAHDTQGYAEHEWAALAKPSASVAIYMGVKAARFVQGRLMLHGAAGSAPVTVIENVSRGDEKRVSTTLADMVCDMDAHGITGPAIIFIGIQARAVAADALSPEFKPETEAALASGA